MLIEDLTLEPAAEERINLALTSDFEGGPAFDPVPGSFVTETGALQDVTALLNLNGSGLSVLARSDVDQVPEPASLLLMGTGLVSALRRRQRSRVEAKQTAHVRLENSARVDQCTLEPWRCAMAKEMRCGDLMPGCDKVIEGKDEADVMSKAAEHAKKDHDIAFITPDLEQKVRGAIHERR